MSDPHPTPIRIWQPEERDGETVWVRPPPGPFGDHYAAIRELRPRRGPHPRRVAFFGESAAAGYLYAPHRTPAMLLERYLDVLEDRDGWEVIDLARTNDTLRPLVAAVEASLQLAPDALVIYAGNNWNLLETPGWSPYSPAPACRQAYAQALAQGGVQAAVDAARRELGALAGSACERLAELARERRLPVVLVLPEVDLADWETRQPVVWLPGDGTARWHALYREASRALAGGRAQEVLAAAWQMIDLDGETCPTSCHLLARAYRALGDSTRARLAAIAAVDAGHYATLACLGSPQATSVARELLRRAAERFGWGVVDLRRVFAAAAPGELPGRRFFLDYCHLTAEGTERAMVAVAAELARQVTGREIAALEPPPSVLPVAAEVEAVARLGAAVHAAHRLLPLGSKVERLAVEARAALDASPGVLAAMADLLAARAAPSLGAPTPAVLTAAQRRNAASPYRLSFQHGWRWDELDADLWRALLPEIARREPATAAELAAALVAHHAADHGPRELARSPYLWEPLERFLPEVMPSADLPARAFLRAPWPTSRFALVASGEAAIALEAVLRLPSAGGAPRRQEVELRVEGAPVACFTVGEGWSRQRVVVPAAGLRHGLNQVEIAWPPPGDGDAALARAVERLALGHEADLHPVLGEVFSLTSASA